MRKVALAALLGLLFCGQTSILGFPPGVFVNHADPTPSYTVINVLLNGQSSGTINVSELSSNAGAFVATITVQTTPPGGPNTVTLGGTDAASFALSPSTCKVTCSLVVGGSNITAASYSITLSAS